MPPKVSVGPVPGGASTVRVQGGRPWNLTEQEYTRQELDHLKKKFEELKAEPLLVGTIVEIREGRMSLSFGPGNAVDIHAIEGAHVGHRVLVTRNTMQAVEAIADAVPTGSIITVSRVAEHGMIEAEVGGLLKTFRSSLEVAKGERVIVDPSMTFVIGSLGMPPSDFSFAPKISVSWDDVGGHAEAKEHLREALELPYSHPELFAAYGKRTVRGVLLSGPSGCIAGDMHVPYSVHGHDGERMNHKGGSFERLYRRFNGLPAKGKGTWQHPESVGARYFVPSMDEDGKIYRNEIEAVIDSGVKRCIRVRTVSGFELVCTPDHPLATENGFFPAAELGVGSRVLTHQNVKWSAGDDEKRRVYRPEVFVKNHPNMRTKIIRMSSGEYEYKRITRARAVYEAHLNGLDLSSYIKLLNDGNLDGLVFSDPRDDIHHRDENPLNDVPDNLVALSHADHAREHAGERLETMRAHVAIDDEIESIEEVGERHTYDIRMKMSPHNFVVAGFVVHNTGKTLLAKAAATAIAKAHGKAATSGFIYVKGPELLSKWIGKSEESVRGLFIAAREHKARHGYPAVVFLDECDSILGTRDIAATTSLNATIVPQFLSEMDGLDDHAAMFILATNRPDLLDAAVTREGRIDRKVKVGRPSREDAKTIFAIHLRDRPLLDDDYADRVVAELYSDERVIRKIDNDVSLRLRDFVSGALIAEIVERASTSAMLRDIESGRKKARGITTADLVEAIGHSERANRDVNHGMAIRDLLDEAHAR